MIVKEFRVDGKVAIVTGASRGIGRAIALTLAEAGANVAIIDIRVELAEQTAKGISKLGRQALAIPTDVTQEDQVKNAVEHTISQFGKIDILCNIAGTWMMPQPVVAMPGIRFPAWAGGDASAEPQSLEEWYRVIDTNLTSVFLFAQAVGHHMIKQKKGKIINISSTSAKNGTPYLSAYCVSKAGVSALTRCLASEWAPFNINVNDIVPGLTNTDMTSHVMKDPEAKKAYVKLIPLGRVAEPRDMALLALYLASEASDYLTGQSVTLDGGAMARGPDI